MTGLHVIGVLHFLLFIIVLTIFILFIIHLGIFDSVVLLMVNIKIHIKSIASGHASLLFLSFLFLLFGMGFLNFTLFLTKFFQCGSLLFNIFLVLPVVPITRFSFATLLIIIFFDYLRLSIFILKF